MRQLELFYARSINNQNQQNMTRKINVNDLSIYESKFSELVMNEHEYLIKCLDASWDGAFSSTRCNECPFEITNSAGDTQCILPTDFPYTDGKGTEANHDCDMFDYSTISDEIEAIKVKVDEYVAEYKAQVLQESQDTFDMMIKEFETNTPKIVATDELYPLKISDSDVDLKSNVISLDDSLDEYVIEYNDKYEVTHTEDGKIVIKRKVIYPKTIGECYEIMNMDYTDFNFSENPSNEEREIYGKLALLRNVIVARNAYWKRLNWKPDWDDTSQVKYCVSHSTPISTENTFHYYQTTSLKCAVCMPDSESRQDFCDKFGAIMNEVIEFI
jgi:hypothetical protein